MKHPSNRELFAYWNERRGARLAPERAEVEPGMIRRVLGDTFVLELDFDLLCPFRIAGTRICALFGRELKGESFIGLWQQPGQTALRKLVAVVDEEKTGVVTSVTGATADDRLLPVNLEMLLLPLAHRTRKEARLLGALAPLETPYWLGAKSIGPLTLGSFRHLGDAVEIIKPPRFQATAGRTRHGLTIYDGGRRD